MICLPAHSAVYRKLSLQIPYYFFWVKYKVRRAEWSSVFETNLILGCINWTSVNHWVAAGSSANSNTTLRSLSLPDPHAVFSHRVILNGWKSNILAPAFRYSKKYLAHEWAMCNLLELGTFKVLCCSFPGCLWLESWFTFHQCNAEEGIDISAPQSISLDALYICKCNLSPLLSIFMLLKIAHIYRWKFILKNLLKFEFQR